MEWIFFAVGVAVIGVIGIALGLVLGRAVARRAARREGVESDSFMTPIGPPPADDADRAGDGTPGADGIPHAGVAPGAGARDDARD